MRGMESVSPPPKYGSAYAWRVSNRRRPPRPSLLVRAVEVAVCSRHVEVAAREVDAQPRGGPEVRDDRAVGEVERLEAARQAVDGDEACPGERRREARRGAVEVREDDALALRHIDEACDERVAAEPVGDAHDLFGRARDLLDPVGGEAGRVLEELVAEARMRAVAPVEERFVAAGTDEALGRGRGRCRHLVVL